jgi:hypothetical protein
MDRCRQHLAGKYTLKNLGPARHVLGWKIDRDRLARTLTILQPSYVRAILSENNITPRQAAPSPMIDKIDLTKAKDDEQSLYQRTHSFSKLLVSLRYLADSTPLDIAYPIGFLRRHAQNPRLSTLERTYPCAQVLGRHDRALHHVWTENWHSDAT